jgi:protein N-terminal methyltransferase
MQERDESTGELKWYSKAKGYWENVSPTVNGVLGGYSYVSNIDVKGSQTFLMPLLKSQPKPWVALGM